MGAHNESNGYINVSMIHNLAPVAKCRLVHSDDFYSTLICLS